MLTKIIQISCFTLLGITLAGCAVSNKPPTCDQLKREWLYYTTNPNIEASWTTDTQKAKLRQQMIDNNCI